MGNYQSIAAQLGAVRRAWKRTAAVSGLCVAVLETLGMLTVAMPIDLLFRPGIAGRMVLAAIVVGGFALLFVRHVVRPLLRRVTDQQVALYVEEHNPGFEGSLMAAAQFGPAAAGAPPALVEAILREAEKRARQLDVRRVVDVRRLRKYGVSALAVVACYGGAGLLFPEAVGRQAVRVLAPWRVPDEPPATPLASPPQKAPLAVSLVQTNASILRGSAWRVEASLSRDPETDVQVHFRAVAAEGDETRWYAMPMSMIEKVHGYEAVLSDINEDMECYVSAEHSVSPTCLIRVYDPLAAESIETVIRYPEYLSLPDRSERKPNGDVAAPTGSVITVRIAANRPITRGELLWETGEAQALAIPADGDGHASARFEAVTNAAYRYRICDAMGQVVESAAPAYVQVLPDLPPSVVLKRPDPVPPALTPIGEMTVAAEVNDDFGVAAADWVYRRGGETEGPELRMPLTMTGEGAARLRVRLESLQPPVAAGEVFTWYLEVRDRKGQTAATDLQVTAVRHFEIWSVEEASTLHAAMEKPPSLVAILQTAWQIAGRRSQLAPRELERQMSDLAQTMIDSRTGKVWEFLTPKPGTPPETIAKMARVNSLAAEGHAALAGRTIDPAVEKLRQAVMIMVAMGLVDNMTLLLPPPQGGEMQTSEDAGQVTQQMQALAELERQQSNQKPDAQQERKQEQADKTAEVERKVSELADAQKNRAQKARDLERKAEANPDPEATRNQRTQDAEEQRKLADKVRQEADKVEKTEEIDKRQAERIAADLRDASRKMSMAADEMQKGRMEKAVQEADAAYRALVTIRDELGTRNQQQLADMLNEVEKRAGRLARDQTATAERTQQAAARPPEQARKEATALAPRQAQLKPDAEKLQEAVTALKQAVDRGDVRPETAKHIQDADREMRRSRVAQKIVNATVALTAAQPADAVREQQKAVEALQKVEASIRQAGDTLATGHEQELRRARNEARQVEERLNELKQAPRPPDPSQPHSEPAEDAVATARRLERHVSSRDFVSPEALRKLSTTLKAADAARLEQEQEKALALAAAAGQVRRELDVAWEKLQANRKLFSSQREECPPQYRPLVNAYFEKLATEAAP